ncbi:hypothetical protein Tco_1315775 [Tanacetum coccineum]
MIQPKSNQQNHKVHARNKKAKKRGLPLTTHDGKVIPDWKEAKKGMGGCLIWQVYADKLPKLLIQSEVMEKKNIDPSNYSISYRLLNNLPLEVSNPTQAGLAYREHLTDFFWKYKIAK